MLQCAGLASEAEEWSLAREARMGKVTTIGTAANTGPGRLALGHAMTHFTSSDIRYQFAGTNFVFPSQKSDYTNSQYSSKYPIPILIPKKPQI